jgi:hypothetical protein
MPVQNVPVLCGDDFDGAVKQSGMHRLTVNDRLLSGPKGRFPDGFLPALHHWSSAHLNGPFQRMMEVVEHFNVGCSQCRHAKDIQGRNDPHLKVFFIPDYTGELDEEAALLVMCRTRNRPLIFDFWVE